MSRTPKHGTASEYYNHRCRCNECRAAVNRYQRENGGKAQKELAALMQSQDGRCEACQTRHQVMKVDRDWSRGPEPVGLVCERCAALLKVLAAEDHSRDPWTAYRLWSYLTSKQPQKGASAA